MYSSNKLKSYGIGGLAIMIKSKLNRKEAILSQVTNESIYLAIKELTQFEKIKEQNSRKLYIYRLLKTKIVIYLIINQINFKREIQLKYLNI